MFVAMLNVYETQHNDIEKCNSFITVTVTLLCECDISSLYMTLSFDVYAVTTILRTHDTV